MSVSLTAFAQSDDIKSMSIEQLKVAIDQSSESEKLIHMSALALEYVHARNVADGLPFTLQALRYEEQYPNPELRGELNTYAALFYTWNHAVEDAAKYYDLAYAYFTSIGDLNGQARVLRGQGAIYNLVEEFDKAIEYNIQALEIAKSVGDEIDILIARNNLATGKILAVEYAMGEQQYQISPTQISDENLNILRELKGVYHELLKTELEIPLGFYGVLNFNRGLVNNHLGHCVEAIENLRAAIVVWKKLGSDEGLVRSYSELAKAYYGDGKYKMALEQLDLARAAMKVPIPLQYQLHLLKYRVPILLGLGDIKTANEVFAKYKFVSERYAKESIKLRLNATMVLEDIRRKDILIDSLNLENRIKESDLSRERLQSMMQWMGIIVLLVMLLLVWLGWRTRIRSHVAIEAYNKVLTEQALTDGLTGLYNRRAFDQVAKKEFQRFERKKKAFSLALLDLDQFKKINDVYGHTAGDDVLRSLANVIKESVREEDTACRWGGEEFIILFSETTKEEAMLIVSRILNSFKDLKLSANGTDFSSSFTAGISEISKGQSLQDIFSKSDDALYKGKELGRSQVVVL